MQIFQYSCLLLFLVLQACNLGADLSSQPPNPDSLENARTGIEPVRVDTGIFHRVTDDRIAGRIKPGAFSQRDAATGTVYEINPNWRILQREPRNPGRIESNALTQTWTDSSGQLETRVYECVSASPSSFQNSIGCQVEPDFILVGGGAWADYGSGAGAMLWETRPLDGTLTTWVASSKAHIKDCNHILHTYAIGMRLKGNNGAYIPKSDLLNKHLFMVSKTTSPAQHTPTFESNVVTFPDGQIAEPVFFGGGARDNWSCCGALLTMAGTGVGTQFNFPHWRAAAKDHYRAELTTLTVYAIVAKQIAPSTPMSAFIPNFGSIYTRWAGGAGAIVATGEAVAIADVEPGFAMVGMAGEARVISGEGRLLTGIRATGTWSGQVSVYSKDHRYVTSGRNFAMMMEAKRLTL